MTFKTLIQMAPFEEKRKQDLLAKVDSLSSDEVAQITEEAWTLIAAMRQIKQDTLLDEELEKVEKGEAPKPDIMKEVTKQLDFDFKKQVEKATTHGAIADVKETISQHT